MSLMQPNVFFLAVDSLRADAVFGDHIQTPNLDRIASRGASFHQCICTCTTTTPSFSSMLTGCYPPKHGVRGLQGYRLNSGLTTMAQAFHEAGYNTYAEVTGPLVKETGILRGFEHAHHRQAYKVAFFDWRERVVEMMKDLPSPWFLMLHIWEVHRPYRAPPDFKKRNDRGGYEAAVAATDEWLAPVFEAVGDDALTIVTGDHGESYANSQLEQKMLRAARKARSTFRFNKWLPAVDKKLAGLAVGHGFALYEHLVRVPLLMAGPGVDPVQVDQQVRHVDLFPTVAEIVGLPGPSGIDGRSLRPLMRGEPSPEEPAYMEAVGVKLEGRRITGVRTSDWKLLQAGSRSSLYKLNGGQAPDEKRNLYSRYPEVARNLEAYIRKVTDDASDVVPESGMTGEEEAIVEQHLRDLGYL